MLQLIAAGILLAVSVRILFRSRRSHRLPLPPGPPRRFLWGNEFPPVSRVDHYEGLTRTYGPVISLKRGSQIVVMLGRRDAALEIMERSGASVADRPTLIPTNAVSGGMRILFMGYGERFRKFRRALHTHLNPNVISAYHPVIVNHSYHLIQNILHDPEHHQVHTKTMTCSNILSITYGKTTITLPDDPEVDAINKVLWRIGQIMRPGAYIVELLPFLEFVPFYMKKFDVWHQEELSLFHSQLEAVKRDRAIGKAPPSFANDLLAKQSQLGLSNDEVAYLAGSMFGAGSHSTAVAISIVILAAATHLQEQAIVYDEIKSVVGDASPPTFEHIPHLKKLDAFVTESYRWRPVSTGTAHRATADIIWKDYCIPKGSIVTGNHWSITRDPTHFPDPEVFQPSRWFGDDGKLIGDAGTFFSFGFGRRVCPGQYLAHSTIMFNAALLLWSFSISEDGTRPINTSDFSGGLIMSPAPFAPKFEKRNLQLETFLAT